MAIKGKKSAGSRKAAVKPAKAVTKADAQLEALKQEVARLREENALLREELEQFIDRWETLDGDAVATLVYLSRFERGKPQEIAKHNKVNIQIVETYLTQLVNASYVKPHRESGRQHFRLAPKGHRYLRERGLHATK